MARLNPPSVCRYSALGRGVELRFAFRLEFLPGRILYNRNNVATVSFRLVEEPHVYALPCEATAAPECQAAIYEE